MDIRFLTWQDIFLGTRQNYLIYFSYKKYFRFVNKSIGLSEESIENITTSDGNFARTLIIIHYQTENLMKTV